MGVPDVDNPTSPMKKRQRLSLKAVRQKAQVEVKDEKSKADNTNNSASTAKTSPTKSSNKKKDSASVVSSSSESLTTSDSMTSTSGTSTSESSVSYTDSSASDSKTDTRVPAVASLENFGNTCFMNSVMQVLRYTPGFLDNLAYLFQDIQASEKIKKKNKTDDEEEPTPSFEEKNNKKCWKVVKNVYKVYRDLSLLETKYEEVASDDVMSMAVKPLKILQSIRDLNPMFEGNLQHDAQEFLRCFLCYLQDAEKEVQKFYSHLPQKFSPKAGLNPIMQKFLQSAKSQVQQLKMTSQTQSNAGVKQEMIKTEKDVADNGIDIIEKVKVNLFTKPESKSEAVKSPTKMVVGPQLGDTANEIKMDTESAKPHGARTEPGEAVTADGGNKFETPVDENGLALKIQSNNRATARRGRRFKPYDTGLSRADVSDISENKPVSKSKLSKRGKKAATLSDNKADSNNQPTVKDMFGKTYSNKKRLGIRGGTKRKSAEDLFQEMQDLDKKVSTKDSDTDKHVSSDKVETGKENKDLKEKDNSSKTMKNHSAKAKKGKCVESAKSISPDGASIKTDIETAKESMEITISQSNAESENSGDTSISATNSQSFQDIFSTFITKIEAAESDSDSVELSDSDSEDIVQQKKKAKIIHESPRRSPRKTASDLGPGAGRATARRLQLSKLCLGSKSASAVESAKTNIDFSVNPESKNKQNDATIEINTSQNATSTDSSLADQNSGTKLPLDIVADIDSSMQQIKQEPIAVNIDTEATSSAMQHKSPVVLDPVVKLMNCDHVLGDKSTSVSASYASSCLTPVKRSPRKYSSNYLKHRSLLETLDIKNEADLQRAIDEMFNSPVKSRSKYDLTERLFQGTMMLRTRCLTCEASVERQEDFHDVSVPVRLEKNDSDDEDEGESEGESRCSLLDLIEASTEVEKLLADNRYFCEECMAYVEAERSLHYDVMPDILTLHLKRFSAGTGKLGYISKINDPIDIPLVLPCLRYKCPENCLRPDHRYKLYGIVTHSGATLSSGHYLSYVRALPKHKTTTMHNTTYNSSASVQTSNKPSDSSQPTSTKKQPLTRRKAGVAPKLPSRFDDNVVTNTKVKAFANVAPKKVKTDITKTLETSQDFTDEWFECDDETVRVFEEYQFADLLSGNDASLLGTPYLLFYHKATLC